ncbi:MAG TPA: FAD-binding protein, partial [Longimicrobium sp.]|nr:FAD-binding protein [Longimicrobium sp.]
MAGDATLDGWMVMEKMPMLPPREHEAKPDGAAWPLSRLPSVPADAVPLPLGPVDGFRGEWVTDEARRTPFGDASGILRGVPDAVAVPADADDVAALVRWASSHNLKLIPRGAGTGMPGGNVGRGISVDMVTHFRAQPAVDAERRTATAGPGVTLAELNAAALAHGLHFP